MDSKDEIKSRLDIVDLLSGYIRLTPAGTSNFKALCPFHNEKSPSFMVSRERQIWKCFGCGKGGDIFSFVMEMEGVEFKEALRILAGKAGIQLKKQDPKIQGQKNRTMDCIDAASRFFYQVLLNAPQAQHARDYLKNRGIADETIDSFKIGYAPNSWDLLYNALRKKEFFEREIEDAGLIIKRQQGQGYYDRFRNRVMFPIMDINGNVIAFSGRILDLHTPNPSQEEPNVDPASSVSGSTPPAKYINSPQTILFDKSKIIYGMDKAKQEIRKNNLAIVVEGQMDVISSHQAGIKNVIASSGTALTLEHVKLIKRYTNNIALCFDNDAAGKNAALRAVDAALAYEMNIKIIKLIDAKDPDECVRKNPNDWIAAIKNAPLFLEYYFNEVFSASDLRKVEDKKNAAKKLLPLIAKISDKVEQTHYIQKLANNLNIPDSILRETLQKAQKPLPKIGAGAKSYPLTAPKDKHLQIAERIIAFSLIYFENFPYVIEKLLPEFIENDRLNRLYKSLIIYYTENQGKLRTDPKFNFAQFKKWIGNSAEIEDYLSDIWLYGEKEAAEYEESGEDINPQRIKFDLENLISRLKEAYNKKIINGLQIKIQKAEEENDIEKITELTKEVKRMMEKL
ncbi:MAG: DNA primase [bacterium]